MKKLAIFVEGQTEQLFIEKYVLALVQKQHLIIEKYELVGGKTSPRQMVQIQAATPASEARFYVLIANCRTDGRVISDIRDRYENLVCAKYAAIIAVRDVYPIPKADLAKLRNGLEATLPKNPVPVTVVLGVMEIESWFLAEYTHFPKIHTSLDAAGIAKSFGFDPAKDDMQHRPNPADDLHKIYSQVGFAYRKTRAQINRTLNALDFGKLYLELPPKFADLAKLNHAFDCFFA